MSNVTVLHVVPDLRQSAGGIASMVPALAGSLVEHGIDSRFVTANYDADSQTTVKTTLVQHAKLWYSRAPRQLVLDTISSIAESQIVICHSHGLWHPLNHLVVQVATALKLPLVISVHGMLQPWARQNKKLKKDFAWMLYQYKDLQTARAIHVTSEAEFECVADAVSSDGLNLIPFGTDLPDSNSAAKTVRAAKTLLFLGRMHPVKNLERLIKAFARVSPEGWVLILAGPDENGHRRLLEALVSSLDATRYITFLEPVYGAEKTTILSDADAIVLPSFTENFGSVVAEALACSRPVIASKGTPWECLESEGCGWWVDPDIAGLTAAIEVLVDTTPADLSAMGTRGRALISREFSWETSAAKMSVLYKSLVG